MQVGGDPTRVIDELWKPISKEQLGAAGRPGSR